MKTNRTFLPVSIATNSDHERGNQIEQARNQIQAASFYLQSLFNSVKHVASHLETEVEDQLQETCCDLQCLAELGYSVSNSIFAAVSKLETANEETSIKPDAAREINEPENSLSVAEMLSYLITSEDVPNYISDGVSQVMIDFFNDQVDQREFVDATHSPEYIERLLRNHYPRD